MRLVDTGGKGVSEITPSGVVAGGKSFELDCLIFASGFEVGTSYTRRAGYEVTGSSGVRLSQYWADRMRTLHGIHVHGFPNLLIVQPTQGANLISNVPHNIVDSAATIAATIRHALSSGHRRVSVSAAAEEAWIRLLLSGPERRLGGPDRTPGYYNNEGQDAGPAAKLRTGYPAGAQAYFGYIRQWRESGTFEGLEFT
ncbi:MAG TPA: hypothetical protein VGG75_36025 [Trebonia sp.]